MNVNFEAIEKAWFKPKKTVLDELEEWLKSNFWNDDEGNESYQIEKYTTYYSVYNKIQELKKENENG